MADSFYLLMVFYQSYDSLLRTVAGHGNFTVCGDTWLE